MKTNFYKSGSSSQKFWKYIYKAGSFSKFDVRVPDTSFSDDIAKPNEVNQTK